jgi:hypothetical protein
MAGVSGRLRTQVEVSIQAVATGCKTRAEKFLSFSGAARWGKNKEGRSRAAETQTRRPFAEGRDMTAETIPVTVADDAAARVAELGMQRQFEEMLEHAKSAVFEEMLEHAKSAVPHLRYLRVTLEYDPARPQAEPGVVIWAHRSDTPPDDVPDLTDWNWGRWQVETFPPQVFQHFGLLSVYGGIDGW